MVLVWIRRHIISHLRRHVLVIVHLRWHLVVILAFRRHCISVLRGILVWKLIGHLCTRIFFIRRLGFWLSGRL